MLRWSALDPYRETLADGVDHYVEPPHHAGTRLARRLSLPGQRVALWGPVGSGKSTELRAAARRLVPDALAAFVALDDALDLRHVPPDWEVFAEIGRAVLDAAGSIGLQPSPPLRERLELAGLLRGPWRPSLGSAEVVVELLRELQRRKPVVILIDGLEKPSPEVAREVLRVVTPATREANLAVVLSPMLVTGPAAYEVLTDLGFRETALRAAVVDPSFGEAAEEGRAFLNEIASRRLGTIDPALAPLFDRAAVLSGGIPRTFLQLLRDAHTAAALAGRDQLVDEDLDEAYDDHRSSMRRLLQDGDIGALLSAKGTTGVEMPVDRRTRLLAHGLLLEYDLPGKRDPVVVPHPLLGLGD